MDNYHQFVVEKFKNNTILVVTIFSQYFLACIVKWNEKWNFVVFSESFHKNKHVLKVYKCYVIFKENDYYFSEFNRRRKKLFKENVKLSRWIDIFQRENFL